MIKTFDTRNEPSSSGLRQADRPLVFSALQHRPFDENQIKQLHPTVSRGGFSFYGHSEQVRRLEKKVEREKIVLATYHLTP